MCWESSYGTVEGVFFMRGSQKAFLAALAVAMAAFAASCGADAQPPSPTPASISFPKTAVDNPFAPANGRETAVISGGCFWGIQAVYEHTKGVISATSGYTGGTTDTAQYETVSSGKTSHAESVKVVFDPSEITYGQILMIFFSVAHNPTELNKQGPDWGTQYRSSVFYGTPEQKKIAEAYITQLNAAKIFASKIMTQGVPLNGFYPAEGYHQDYLKHHTDNPYIVINDLPKIQSLKKQFPELYREY